MTISNIACGFEHPETFYFKRHPLSDKFIGSVSTYNPYTNSADITSKQTATTITTMATSAWITLAIYRYKFLNQCHTDNEVQLYKKHFFFLKQLLRKPPGKIRRKCSMVVLTDTSIKLEI